MAADVALGPQTANPCCVELKKRYLKLEEKRNALRQAVKLLEAQATKVQDENAALKEVCEEERRQAVLIHQAKEKESDIKRILEKEIQDLKSKIASLHVNGNLIDQDRNRLLETRILRGEAEIKRLNGLLQQEIKKAETEKKKVLEEKKKAAEAWELMKIEQTKAEEQKRFAEMERKKAEGISCSLAKAKSEANDAREKVIEERRKAEVANKKVELERKKASKEKKCADIERAKVEKQVELVEMERKKSMDEKERADHLSKQLEEERKRREEVQREMEEVVSSLQGLKSCSGNYKTKQLSSSKEVTEFANMKLLKSKLKLRKNELKHAKRMAKLEKSEKQLLLQQLRLLKQDHFKFSRRLEMLINCSSYGIKGTDGLTKLGGYLDNCTDRCFMEPQRKCVCAEHGFDYQNETNCTAMRCMGPLASHTWHLPKKCQGRATGSISGISSDLESPVGDSVGDKLQNSALCSTDVTYSDAPFMGSQGRSAFAVATSAKLTNDSFQRSPSVNFTSEKSLHVAQEKIDGSNFNRKMDSPCLKSMVCKGTQTSVGDFQSSKGRREAQITLDAERCSCCLKMNKNNSMVEDISSKSLIPRACRPCGFSNSNVGKSSAAEFSDDSDPTSYEFHGKKRLIKRQKLGLLASDQTDNHGHNETCCTKEGVFPFPDAKEYAQTCRNKSSNILINNQAAIVCLENVTSGNFMKLLDLEDDAEEQKYQAARARPLSPTLPRLQSPRRRHSLGDYHASDTRCGSKGEKLVPVIEPQSYNSASSSQGQLDPDPIPESINPCDTLKVIGSASLLMPSLEHSQSHQDGGVHVDSSSDACALANEIKNAPKTSHGSDLSSKRHSREPCNEDASYHMSMDNILENRVAVDKANDLAIDKGAQTGGNWKSWAIMKIETVKLMPLHKVNELECGNGGLGHEQWGIHGCCVVFSNVKDEQEISRILCARNAIIHDASQGGNAGFSLVMVLHALAANLDLSAKEQACVLFSWLLCKVSSLIPVECAKYMDGDLASVSELVIAEMNKVFDDNIEVFTTTCLLDAFVSLIQDFLTARKVLVCGDASCEQSSPGVSYHSDNENRIWSLKTAGVTQLVAGSVILASISTMHDCVDILWQTSFQLIQMCQSDSHWILTAVHVFASVCGVKFFSPTDQHLMLTAIKSLIFLLEKGEVTPNGDECPRFSPCTECPFAEGQVCEDKVISSLLEDLQICISDAARYQDSQELSTTYDTCQTHNRCGSQSNQFDGSSRERTASCALFDSVCQIDRNAVAGFCHFTDVVSLVDLFGCFMEWECVYSKIIQRLFTLLESCSSPAFSVSLLVLIGHLGRIGIENRRCDQRDVEGLMFSLLTFMDTDRVPENNLHVQLAAVEALLNLLALDFREIVEGPLNMSLISSQVAHVEHIRTWFQHLGEEQKAMSLRLFQNSDVKEN